MYYHCRDLKYVVYGKVLPPPDDVLADDWLLPAYRWLGHYCGFCPQVWLSRSQSAITGIRVQPRSMTSKKRPDGSFKVKTKIHKGNSVLFGFENIQGFPLRYDTWEFIMNAVINDSDFDAQNQKIVRSFQSIIKMYEEDGEELDNELQDWVDCDGNLDAFLKKHLFVKEDQVVVPSLNLKAAKKIICSNERQKKKLRKMGFIEDRIQIKNLKKSV